MTDRSSARTILIVEDEALVRSVTRRMLESSGYDVLLAEDAQSATEVFTGRTRAIDLVVTDLSMHRMSGHELAKRLRALDPAIKILFLSGYSTTEVELDEHSDFLAKPFSREAFLSNTKRLLAAP